MPKKLKLNEIRELHEYFETHPEVTANNFNELYELSTQLNIAFNDISSVYVKWQKMQEALYSLSHLPRKRSSGQVDLDIPPLPDEVQEPATKRKPEPQSTSTTHTLPTPMPADLPKMTMPTSSVSLSPPLSCIISLPNTMTLPTAYLSAPVRAKAQPLTSDLYRRSQLATYDEKLLASFSTRLTKP